MKYLVIVILMVLVGCQDDSEVSYSDEVYELADLTYDRCETEQYTEQEYLDFVMDETCDGGNTSLYLSILNHYTICGVQCPLDGVPVGCDPIGTACN